MRSCGDIDDLYFLIKFFENLQKRPGQLRLIQTHFFLNVGENFTFANGYAVHTVTNTVQYFVK